MVEVFLRMMRRSIAIVLIATTLIQGCGYFVSGTWDDDPDNWGRAFNSVKPDEVVVLHSRYSRFPHFTLEFEYFFEIEHNDSLVEQLFTQNRLVKKGSLNEGEFDYGRSGEAPPWFAPKSLDSYDIWIGEDSTRSNFQVLIDKETLHLFLTDYLL
jgi:hypothetical protein